MHEGDAFEAEIREQFPLMYVAEAFEAEIREQFSVNACSGSI